MSGILMARMLSALMPEEVMLEKAIEALTTYKETKFGGQTQPQIEATHEGLKDFFENNPHQSESNSNTDVEPPFAELATILMKWKDMGKSMEEIMSDSATFEAEIAKTDLIKKDGE